MVTAKVGSVITADTIKSGTSQKGNWAFGEIKAEKGYDKIQVWFKNPEIKSNTNYKIVSIQDVTKSARKYTDKDGAEKWADTYSITAVTEPCSSSEPVPEGFSKLDEDLPF